MGERLHGLFQGFRDRGLLAAEEPARLIVGVLAAGKTGEVVNIYEPRGEQLLGDD